MTENMIMPRLGETVVEGTILKWLKHEGDVVQEGEVIVEISTDKVDTELSAPATGIIKKILAPEGTTVPVNTDIAIIEDSAAAALGQRRGAAPPGPPGPSEEGAEASKRAQLSPIVRKLAAEHGVDLSKIRGTGEGGRITKRDVLKYAQGPREVAAGESRVPISHMRKAIAEHMLRSLRTSAHVTAVVEADMSRIVSLRATVKERFQKERGFPLTYLPFLARAVVESIKRYPVLNARLDDDTLVISSNINLGIAVALENGLIVPVVKGADKMGLVELAQRIHELADRARNGKLAPDEVHEGTFTITNPGSFGSLLQTPIINQPQVAILSFESIEKRPVVIDDAIAIRSMVYLPLSYDHRVLDGAIASKFLVDVKKNLADMDFAAELNP